MNNNFTKTEKSLKHWLKNKITVTSATVVSFLIMGTVAFGAVEIKGETQNITENKTFDAPIEVIKENETIGVSINKENVTLTNNSTITAKSKNTTAFGIKSDVKANIVNTGTITVEALNKDKPNEPDTYKDVATAIALNKGGRVENNGDINATGFRAIGIDSDNGTEVINTKNITISGVGNYNGKAKTGSAIGIRLYNDSTAVNHGDITTTSKDLSQGVNINVSKNSNLGEKNIFENYGTITANSVDNGGGSSHAIYVKNDTDKNVKIVNEKGGTLKAVADKFKENSSTATVKLEGVVNQGQPKGTTTFVNNGTILTENNGFGIYASDNKSSVTNNGSITVSKGNKVTGVETFGSFVNTETGKIDVNSTSDAHGLLVKGTGNAVNQGTINVTGGNNGLAIGVETTGNASFTNEKDIIVNNVGDTGPGGPSETSYGVYLNNSNTFKNTGDITATAQDSAIGVLLDGGDKSNLNSNNEVIVNTGSITAESLNGGMASAIYIKNTKPNQNADLAFSNSGTLKATGNQDTSVVKLQGNRIDFINTGVIEAGKGTAISLTGSKITATNSGTIKVEDTGKVFDNFNSLGTATNNGIIQITNKTAEELKDFNTNNLFNGTVDNKNGLVTDSTGKDINDSDSLVKAEIYTSELTGESIKIGKGDKSTLIGDEDATVKTLHVVGKVQVGDKKEANEVKLAVQNLNFTSNANFNVGADDTLILGDQDTSIIINMAEDQSKVDQGDIITLENGAELGLQNATINKGVNISGAGTVSATGKNTINSNITSNEFKVYDGETLFNGVLSSDTVTVDKGALNKDTKLTFSSEASFGKATTINSNDGTTVFEIGAKGENALANSQGKVDVNGNVDFNTDKLTQNTTVDLGKQNDLKDAIYNEKANGIYNTKLDKDNNELEFTYNKQLFTNEKLNAVNNGFQVLGDKVTSDIAQRESLADEVYSSNIYSTTVRVAYDNLRLNEETLLSMNHRAGAGELKTFGKGLFSKDKFERRGINNDYSVDVETTGLLAGLEYGLSDSTTVGTVFSGSKQDVDVDHGSSDGDVLYLGVFGNKVVNNYDFTAGLGYQFGKYESDNSLISNTGDKYDSNAISGYVQGRYTADLGNGLSLQPRIKFGYTHLEQDDVRDANFALTNSDINTFNTEAGVDFVKTVQLDSSKLDVKLGTAYIKTMGDTDKTFTGQFFGDAAGSQFEVLGGELTENTIKFSLDAEMTFENGFFYNAGVNYRFGGEDTKVYGASVGVGYTF